MVVSSLRLLPALVHRTLFALAALVVAAGWIGCVEDQPTGSPSVPPPVSVSAAVLAEDGTFTAYYGDDQFDLDRVRAGDADFSFVAIRGPLAALDGEQRTFSLSERGAEDWAISYNLIYGAGDSVEWSVLTFVPGQDGLSGVVSVMGDAENLGVVTAHYQLGFVGVMNLPVVGDANLQISIENNGGAAAQFEQ